MTSEHPAALAERFGIERVYRDAWGNLCSVPDATIERLARVLQNEPHAPPKSRAHHASGAQCFQPNWNELNERLWGVSVQLYGLRTQGNWGIGDFSDLRRLLTLIGKAGGGFVMVNPLHAMFAAVSAWISPYSPSSREFLNTLYIDVTAMRSYACSSKAQSLANSPSFASAREELRHSAHVDYEGVAACKNVIFRAAFDDFTRSRTARAGNPLVSEFKAFCRDRGDSLRRFAIYQALSCQKNFGPDWRRWPEEFRNPGGHAVARFAEQNARDVDYHSFLQWEADTQLANCSRIARESGMRLGLCLDLALGTSAASADGWMEQACLIPGFHIGAPPDQWNEIGQDWGLGAYNPVGIAEGDFAHFRRVLAANMRHAQGLRIDHILGLNRLFLVPSGGSPRDGAYLRYPMEGTAAALCEQSQQHRCLVIGEDLGTVPEGMRQLLTQQAILSSRLLIFETDQTGQFIAPERYPDRVIVSFSTHDLPTFRGFWSGTDLDIRSRLALFPSHAQQEAAYAQRERDRRNLLAALQSVEPSLNATDMSLLAGLYRFMARTPCRLLQLQLEDLAGECDQPNLPGTKDEYPNWRRKLTSDLEDLFQSESVRNLLDVVRSERPDHRRLG